MNSPKAHLYREPINIRLSPEKLADFVRWSSGKIDSGDVFIFFNRKRNHCKVIWHYGESFTCIEKRLEKGTFAQANEISLPPGCIENCIYGGLPGAKDLLHALMGNVLYLDDSRKQS